MGSATAKAAYLGAYSAVYSLVVIILYVLFVVAFWRIFKKAGLPGWKSIIPFYNEFLLFKISWKTSFFWISLALAVIGCIVMSLDPGRVGTVATNTAVISFSMAGPLSYVGGLFILASAVITYICLYKICIAFGHGLPFFILMFFLPFVALLYLGFSQDEYKGNPSELQI